MKSFKEEMRLMMLNQKLGSLLIKGKNIRKALYRYTDRAGMGIDLLAVAKNPKSLLTRMFSGSISHQLFLHAHIHLLKLQVIDISDDRG